MARVYFFLCLLISSLLTAANSRTQPLITHGPIIGGVTHDSAKLLLRTDVAAEVIFELSTTPGFEQSSQSQAGTTQPDQDYFIAISASGLQADTRYFYRPLIDGQAADFIGQFKTFPPPGVDADFTFAFGGCQQNFRDSQSNIGRVFPLIAQDSVRFFIQLGDWSYPDTTDTEANPNDFFNTVFSRVQASYRGKYNPTYPMAELFRVAPIDYIYDDHDYSNDNCDRTFPGRDNSLRGYHEMFPHYPLPNGDNGAWHKFTFGNAEFFVLDTRTQRNSNAAGFIEDSTGFLHYAPSPSHRILQSDASISGELQMDWLIRELQQSSAHWKFIATGVPFNPASRLLTETVLIFQGGDLDPIPIPGGGITSAANAAVTLSDSWNGFHASSDRLIQAVHDAGIENIIVLSGDSHTGAIDDGANAFFPEIMAGALDRSNTALVAFSQVFGIDIWNAGGQTIERNNFNSHYGRVTVFGRDSVRLELVDEFDDLIASHTVLNGKRTATVGLNAVMENLDFGQIPAGTSKTQRLILVCAGPDTVFVTDIASSSVFRVSPRQLAIPPGQRRFVDVTFAPSAAGRYQANLPVTSNDPQSPQRVMMRAEAGLPTTVEEPGATPEAFNLAQNYPNPFNAGTRIRYRLSTPASITLRIFNFAGQEVRRFVELNKQAGEHVIDWNGYDNSRQRAASGVYIYQLYARNLSGEMVFTAGKKMLLLQ